LSPAKETGPEVETNQQKTHMTYETCGKTAASGQGGTPPALDFSLFISLRTRKYGTRNEQDRQHEPSPGN
jgi:hypothetical protein